MPTYEYACPRCGRFDYWQNIKDDPLASCPTCGGSVRRLISRNISILFKGSGFHVTDYRSSDYKARAKAEQGESSPASSDGSGKSKVS